MRSNLVFANASKVLFATLFLVLPPSHALAQAPSGQSEPRTVPGSYETLYLNHVTEQDEANQILTVLRNFVQRARINYVAQDKAFSIYATPEDMETAKKIVADLDKPDQTYRVTYTIREMTGGNPTGETQHVTLLMTAGQRSYLKQGKRVPLVTGTTAGDAKDAQQVTYIDVGLNIDATVRSAADSARLTTRIEESSVADERSGIGTQDPVIRQTSLSTTDVQMTEGKPVVLGLIDIPGTAKQEQIEAVAESVLK